MANELQPQSETTVLVLSNAAALVTAIMTRVCGGDVAETLNGSVLGRDAFDNLFYSHLARKAADLAPATV